MSKIRMRYVNIDGERYLQIGRHRIKEQSLRGVIRFVAVASIVTMVGGRVASNMHDSKEDDHKVTTETEYAMDTKTVVDAQDLESLHPVLVNGGLNPVTYQETLEQLKEKGVSVSSFEEGMPIEEDATVIRLVGGKQDAGDIALYGPLAHESGNHDNLLVSFEEACKEQGYVMEPAHFGKNVGGVLGKTTLEQQTNGKGTLLTIETKDMTKEQLAQLLLSGLGNYSVQREMTPNQNYYHVVQAGEIMGNIASFYGYSSVEELAAKNGIASPDKISIGTVLKVKDTPPINVSVNTVSSYNAGIGRVQ